MKLSVNEYMKTGVAQEIQKNISEDQYKDSVFYGLKTLSSKAKGTQAEKLFIEFMESQGHQATKPSNSDHDCIINGHKVEIKTSFYWKNTEKFTFQQIRPKQDYDFIVFIAIRPESCDFYICDKETSGRELEVQDENGLWTYNQHGGKTVNSGTFWIRGIDPKEVEWMKELGDQLDA